MRPPSWTGLVSRTCSWVGRANRFNRTLSTAPSFPVPLPQDDLPLPATLFHHNRATPCDCRMRDHYYQTVQGELMYLTYNHQDPQVQPKLEKKPYIPGLTEKNKEYKKDVTPRHYDTLMRKPCPARDYTNVPKLKSIVVHTFLKESVNNKYVLLNALTQLESITGKTPTIVKSKSNVALWKLRENMPVGAKVELMDDDMYQFLDKFVELVLPRLKNWYGLLETSGDGTGNIQIGFHSQVMSYFPEIEQTFDRYPFMTGFEITFKTTAYNNWEARTLLSAFQIPIENAISKAKREKYNAPTKEIDPNEPEWMKYKRAKDLASSKKK
jgi:large subunit ribosomal protein L5